MRSKFLPFEILFEDRDLIVIDKPAGLLSTHTALRGRARREGQLTAENLLNAYVRKGQWRSAKRVFLVHRLDRETSGVMMFVKSPALAEAVRERWNALTEKTYHARVEGVMAAEKGVFESFLDEDDKTFRVRSVPEGRRGKKAKTLWRRVRVDGDETLVEASLKSGRKHQIRVHFAEAGHPVVGDRRYGHGKGRELCLRAVRLKFTHPFSSERFVFEVPDKPFFTRSSKEEKQ